MRMPALFRNSWTPNYPPTGSEQGRSNSDPNITRTQGEITGRPPDIARYASFEKAPEVGFTRAMDRNFDVNWIPDGTYLVPMVNGWARGQVNRYPFAITFHNPGLGLHAYDPTDPGQMRPENA